MTDQPTAAERILTDALRDLIIMSRIPQGKSLTNAECVTLATEYLKSSLTENEFKALRLTNKDRNTGRIPIKTMIAEGLMEPERRRNNGEGGRVVVVTIGMVRDMISLRWNMTKMMIAKLCLAPSEYEWTPSILLADIKTSHEHLVAIEARVGEAPYVDSDDDEVALHILNHMKRVINVTIEIARMAGLSTLTTSLRTSANYPRMYRQRIYNKKAIFILKRMKAVNKEWKDIINAVTKSRAEPNDKTLFMKVETFIDDYFVNFLKAYFGDPDMGDEFIEPADCMVLQFPKLKI